MNAPEHFEALRQTDHLQGHPGNPSAYSPPHEHCPTEQAPPGGPDGPYVPGGRAFETFVGGAGI
jgi:hypothetical protein